MLYGSASRPLIAIARWQLAWASLFWLLFTDLYIVLLSTGTISDLRFF